MPPGLKDTVGLRPVDLLEQEHTLHRRMLSVLSRIAERVGAGHGFPAEDVATVLTYFREFLEQVHHAKERELFLSVAGVVGDETAAETMGELFADHDETKLLLHSLTLFWEPGDLLDAERRGFCDVVSNYTTRLLRHMDEEEQQVYPVVRSVPKDEWVDLLDRFREIAARHRPASDWLRLVGELESTYGVRRS